MGGHLRPEPGAFLYFMIGLFLSPQTGEPSAALPNLMARALGGSIRSSSTMSLWHHWPTHGRRGPKPLEGRAAAAHVGCCVFLWLCFVVHSSLATLVVESLHQPRQNGQLLHTHTSKSAPKDLGCKCRFHTFAISRCGTCVDILAQISFWLIRKKGAKCYLGRVSSYFCWNKVETLRRNMVLPGNLHIRHDSNQEWPVPVLLKKE